MKGQQNQHVRPENKSCQAGSRSDRFRSGRHFFRDKRIVPDPFVTFSATTGSSPILSSSFLRQQDRLRSFHHLFRDNRIVSDPFIIFSATTGSSPILSSSFLRQQDRL